jgi:hypothetical protein
MIKFDRQRVRLNGVTRIGLLKCSSPSRIAWVLNWIEQGLSQILMVCIFNMVGSMYRACSNSTDSLLDPTNLIAIHRLFVLGSDVPMTIWQTPTT